jgi:hypothetical protein
VAEAEALAGDPARGLEIARRELAAGDRHQSLLQRTAGIALARLGQPEAARRELRDALAAARARAADYDIAATIDALAILDAADPALLLARDEILDRLKIVRLPAPVAA